MARFTGGSGGGEGTVGPAGPTGPTGATGATGAGVAAGGTEGQVLLKVDGTDYNTTWADNSAESTFYLVRNNSGSTILKGTLVAASGAEPSGRIDVAPYEVTGLQDSELRVMGVATANINNGANGTVMSFGTLRAIDTRGNVASAIAVGDETWAEGDILYAHPTVDGKLTKVRPQHDLAVAFITVRHASSGQIAIRIVPGNNHLEWMHDVEIDTPADNEVLAYDSASGVWKNQTPLDIGLVGPTGATGATGATGPVGISWRGEFESFPSPAYAVRDAVSYEGSSYIIVSSGVAGTPISPSGSINTGWSLLANKGLNGDTGPTGADGGFSSTQTIESVGSSRALTSADVGKLITNSGAITITVEGLSVGQQVDFLQTNASQITFTAGSGMTLNSKDSKLKTNAQYSPASVKCIATNTYVLVGDLGV